jgi:hypothetical protein
LNTLRRGSERGSILILTALAMVMLLGVTALAVDAGYFFAYRNRMAAAADAAALAGARAYKNGYTDTTTLTRMARNQAYLNSFQDGSDGVVVTINRPPTSGPFAGQATYVEAIVSRAATPSFFAAILRRTSFNVGARAVAGPGAGPLANIIALCKTGATTYNYADCDGIVITATTTITANSGIIDNSTDHNSFSLGTHSILQASDFKISDPFSETENCTTTAAGTTGINCRTVSGSTATSGIVHYSQTPTLDPLQGTTAPSCVSCTTYTADVICSPTCSTTGTNVVQPAIYQKKLTLGGGTVYMNGGVYVSSGPSDFIFTGSGTDKVYTCGYGPSLPAGCTNTGGITLVITGSGNLKIQTNVILRARSDGMLIYQSGTQSMVVGGGSAIDIAGVIYAPLASVSFTGGSTGTTISTTSFIVHDFSLGGSGGGIIFNPVSLSALGTVSIGE